MYDGPDLPSTDLPEDHTGLEPSPEPLDATKISTQILGYETTCHGSRGMTHWFLGSDVTDHSMSGPSPIPYLTTIDPLQQRHVYHSMSGVLQFRTSPAQSSHLCTRPHFHITSIFSPLPHLHSLPVFTPISKLSPISTNLITNPYSLITSTALPILVQSI